jgi:hypothetical protein
VARGAKRAAARMPCCCRATCRLLAWWTLLHTHTHPPPPVVWVLLPSLPFRNPSCPLLACAAGLQQQAPSGGHPLPAAAGGDAGAHTLRSAPPAIPTQSATNGAAYCAPPTHPPARSPAHPPAGSARATPLLPPCVQATSAACCPLRPTCWQLAGRGSSQPPPAASKGRRAAAAAAAGSG